MEKIETFGGKRSQQFGATDGEKINLRNEVLDEAVEKINEIVEWINKK